MGPNERRLAVSQVIRDEKVKGYTTKEEVIDACMEKFNNAPLNQVTDIVNELMQF